MKILKKFLGVGTFSMRFAGISQPLTGVMNEHASPFKYLREELRQRSCGRASREAMQRFAAAGVDLREATSPFELATMSNPESPNPETRSNLEVLIGLSATDHDAALVTFVAFEAVFIRVAKLVHRAGPTALDVSEEVLAGAWAAIVEVADLPLGNRVPLLVSKTWTKARSATRREHRLRSALEMGAELPEPLDEGDSLARAIGDLSDWVSQGVITAADAEMLRRTRIDGLPLDHFAEMIGTTHVALKHRRPRIEAALREALARKEAA